MCHYHDEVFRPPLAAQMILAYESIFQSLYPINDVQEILFLQAILKFFQEKQGMLLDQ